MPDLKFRWLDPTTPNADQDWKSVEKILVARQWMSLNRHTSRVLLVEDEANVLVGFMAFQLVPFVGPFWLHPSIRGSETSEEMAKEMWKFLITSEVRGWMSIAESPHAAKLCEKFGMDKVENPVYIIVGMEARQ